DQLDLVDEALDRRAWFVAAAAPEAGLGHAAELVDAPVEVARVRAHGRVIGGFEDLEGALVRALGEVVDLDDHAAQHHLVEQRLAERSERRVLAMLADERLLEQLREVERGDVDGRVAEPAEVVGRGREVYVARHVEAAKRDVATVKP